MAASCLDLLVIIANKLLTRGIRGVLVECHLYFSQSLICPHPACIGCIIVRSLLLAGAANSESIVPGPRDWLATYVFLPLRRWHYKFPCKPLICFSQSHTLYYLDLLLAYLGSISERKGTAVYRASEPGQGPPWSWKRKKTLWRKLALWLRTLLTCDHGGVGQQGAFRAFTFSDSKCLQSASRSYSHEILAIRTQILSMLMDLSQLGIQCWPNLNWFHLRLATRPGSRLLIVNSLSKHLAHPFLLPAAHKIVNCLGKQARGNLGVERHKSQRENYGTLLICSWSDGVNEILEDHSALNLFERSFKRLICSSDGMCLQYSVR